ncbi:MAG: hypothetical protein ACJ8AW_47670 [Rhodopila sp.]
MEKMLKPAEKIPEPIELDDAELAAVAGGISLTFGNFGGAQNATSTASGTNSHASIAQSQ